MIEYRSAIILEHMEVRGMTLRLNKLKVFNQALKTHLGVERFILNEENLSFLGVLDDLHSCTEKEQISTLAVEVGRNILVGEDAVRQYIDELYPGYVMTKNGVANLVSYGCLRGKHTKAGRRLVVKKTDIDEACTENVVDLTAQDLIRSLDFGIRMLEKQEDEDQGSEFGSKYDQIAGRLGSFLNYLERWVNGKLGEIATARLLNAILSDMGSPLSVEVSFDPNQVEASDLFQLRDRNQVIVPPGARVQVKTATGLNTVVLKEMKSKVESQTFSADFFVFVQLLRVPLGFILGILREAVEQIGAVDENTGASSLDITMSLPTTDLGVKAKVAGFIDSNSLKEISEGETLKPLGTVSCDAHYAYVADLTSDFHTLAGLLACPRRGVTA
jgi:transcriptional regulator with XRE-family HTH domain